MTRMEEEEIVDGDLPDAPSSSVLPPTSLIPTEAAVAALQQHDQLFHRQMAQLRQQQQTQQQLLQQQYNLQRQMLIENQETQLKSHLMQYLDQHKRMEGVIQMGNDQAKVNQRGGEGSRANGGTNYKKSEVKQKLQEFVLQKKQREIASNGGICEVPATQKNGSSDDISSRAGDHQSECESTDAEVSSLLSSSSSFFKVLPRISPVQEDEIHSLGSLGTYKQEDEIHNLGSLGTYRHSPRSSRSVASPFGDFTGSLGSSSSSLLEEGRGLTLPSLAYTPSPPSHGKQRTVGRTQSAPLPLGHPGLLAPPEVRPGKTSPELEQHALIKQQIRQSVLNRNKEQQQQQNVHRAGDALKSLDPMLAMAELSQIQRQEPAKVRHSSTDNISSRISRPRPISRTRSSPLVTLGASISPTGGSGSSKRTGVAYDPLMLKHACLCGDELSHPESPARLEKIITKIADSGALARCELVRRRATMEELKCCHSEKHVQLFGVSPLVRGGGGLGLTRLACGGWGVDADTAWNDIHTPAAAKIAAGSIIELVNRVGTGSLKNGLGLVRPPGHHAEQSQAMGFCFFNNVAIAAKQIRRVFSRRVLIVDWDVHHGNGTQQQFYTDPDVMYISIHRHDNGNFFPGTGAPQETGSGPGLGSNINIAWSGSDRPLGDAEYLAAFRAVVLPIAKVFRPWLVLVSGGFDAAPGHPPTLGGYIVSPACFGSLTSSLQHLADGKLVIALEGGYTGSAVAEAAHECLKALMGEPVSQMDKEELQRRPCPAAQASINTTIGHQIKYWPCLSSSCQWVDTSHMEYLDQHPMDIASMENLQV